MSLLSATNLATTKALIQCNSPSINPSRNPRFLSIPISRTLIPLSASTSSSSSAAAELHLQEKRSSESLPRWGEFAERVSGEWDGFGAEFTADGKPVELPENVVPEAYREWEVQVFDWQTQCPSLAVDSGPPVLTYKAIKLLPTVGCEADAATVHSVDGRIAGGEENMVSLFGYDTNGCYVAVWPVEGRGGQRILELEHCLVDPGNREVRVRVIQVVGVEEGAMKLMRIKVFSEQWYGPFRNGEQLGGCAIRETGFAATAALKETEVVGVWQGISAAVASFGSENKKIMHELEVDRPRKLIRDQLGLTMLPKQLWCYLKENDGETWGEVGWLFDHGCAMTSRCVFLQDGRLKEIAIVKETAVLEDI